MNFEMALEVGNNSVVSSRAVEFHGHVGNASAEEINGNASDATIWLGRQRFLCQGRGRQEHDEGEQPKK